MTIAKKFVIQPGTVRTRISGCPRAAAYATVTRHVVVVCCAPFALDRSSHHGFPGRDRCRVFRCRARGIADHIANQAAILRGAKYRTTTMRFYQQSYPYPRP